MAGHGANPPPLLPSADKAISCGPLRALGRPLPVGLYCLLLLQTNSAWGVGMVHKCRMREGEGTLLSIDSIVMRKLYFTRDGTIRVSVNLARQLHYSDSHSEISLIYFANVSVLKFLWWGGTRASSNCSKLLKIHGRRLERRSEL